MEEEEKRKDLDCRVMPLMRSDYFSRGPGPAREIFFRPALDLTNHHNLPQNLSSFLVLPI